MYPEASYELNNPYDFLEIERLSIGVNNSYDY